MGKHNLPIGFDIYCQPATGIDVFICRRLPANEKIIFSVFSVSLWLKMSILKLLKIDNSVKPLQQFMVMCHRKQCGIMVAYGTE